MVNFAGKVPAKWLLLASPHELLNIVPASLPSKWGARRGVGGVEPRSQPHAGGSVARSGRQRSYLRSPEVTRANEVISWARDWTTGAASRDGLRN